MTALPQARSQARTQGSTQVRGVVGGGAPSYDTDAQDYFTRAEALGGSFDLSGISGTYTESYVKTAISDFVAGCKTDSIWTKITEAYLLSGVTFSGVLAKLKHAGTAALTNVNFVTGDYLAAGSGAGLLGNGSTKAIQTEFNIQALARSNASASTYVTGSASANDRSIGGAGTSYADLLAIDIDGSGFARAFIGDTGNPATSSAPVSSSFIACSAVSAMSLKLYENGALAATNTANRGTSALANSTASLFAVNVNSALTFQSELKLSFGHIGTGMTDTDMANLSTRVNALMTALGANVY